VKEISYLVSSENQDQAKEAYLFPWFINCNILFYFFVDSFIIRIVQLLLVNQIHFICLLI